MTDASISPLRSAHDRRHDGSQFRAEDPKRLHPCGSRTSPAFSGDPPISFDEDLRPFQLHLTEDRVGAPTINSTVSALRFFFGVTLDRADMRRDT